jgi:hypothetical protein
VELKRGPNTEIGPKDFFEMASTINIKTGAGLKTLSGNGVD